MPNGDPVTSMSVSSSREYKKNGEKVKETTWFKVSVFGGQAEPVNQYLHKGSMVLVEGRLVADPVSGGQSCLTRRMAPKARLSRSLLAMCASSRRAMVAMAASAFQRWPATKVNRLVTAATGVNHDRHKGTRPPALDGIALVNAKVHALVWLQQSKYSKLHVLHQIVDNPNATKERIDHVTATIEAIEMAIKSIDDGFVGVLPEL